MASDTSSAPLVLCVDDDDAGRYLLESIMRSGGFEAVPAKDGLEGLELARDRRPDLIVTDILMPRLDGYQMCVRLRNDPDLRTVPIIVYTSSFGDAADKRFALSLGVDTFLIKPQEPQVLLEACRRVMGAPEEADRSAPSPDEPEVLKAYGERIANKLYEKLVELEHANAELSSTTARLATEVDEKSRLVDELSTAMEKAREAEEALIVSQERYAAAIRGANDGIWDWDLDGGGFFASPRFHTMIGMREGEALGSADAWFERVVPADAERLRFEIDLHTRGLTPYFESDFQVPGGEMGEIRWLLARGQALRRDDGTAYRMAGSLTDVTDRKRQEEQLLYNALYDALTGLANRTLFMDRTRFVAGRAERRPGSGFAVLFLDLDRFKTINESLGHAVGDQLLMAAARRLEACVRPGDTVARIGGDEFAVLISDITDPKDVDRLADTVLGRLAERFVLEDAEVFSSASIGIAVSLSPDISAEEIVRDAETAMYRAKEAGRSRFEVFDAVMHARAVATLKLEAELRRALDRDELEPYFQPVADVPSGRVVGCEALVRWNHPERGVVPPGEFIPLAEETGLIVPMGKVVMEAACRRGREWAEAGLPPVRISVNISALQFRQGGLVDTVRGVLAATRFEPSHLVLEVTESVIMADPEAAQGMLDELHSLGVGLAVDDFGTGYSSLSYLKRFPFHTLKIDRSFVMDVPNDPDDMNIVEAVVGLAHSLKMSVIAEGVETGEQLDYLRGLGCEEVQGFLVSRPVPADAFAEILGGGTAIPPSA